MRDVDGDCHVIPKGGEDIALGVRLKPKVFQLTTLITGVSEEVIRPWGHGNFQAFPGVFVLVPHQLDVFHNVAARVRGGVSQVRFEQ